MSNSHGLFQNKFKSLNAEAIEVAIANLFTVLIEEDCEASVSEIVFELSTMQSPSMVLNVRLSYPRFVDGLLEETEPTPA